MQRVSPAKHSRSELAHGHAAHGMSSPQSVAIIAIFDVFSNPINMGNSCPEE
jgi:hypothetical protein